MAKKKLTKIQRIEKVLSKRVKAKKVFKKGHQVIVEIPEHKESETVPMYFKMEVEDVKKQMFFS